MSTFVFFNCPKGKNKQDWLRLVPQYWLGRFGEVISKITEEPFDDDRILSKAKLEPTHKIK